MEDDPRVFRFFYEIRYPLLRYDHPILDSNSIRTPPALLDSCYYNLFHGTSNLIMGPITIYFLKFAQFICFFYMMNPIIIIIFISVFLVSPYLYINIRSKFCETLMMVRTICPSPHMSPTLNLEILFLFF